MAQIGSLQMAGLLSLLTGLESLGMSLMSLVVQGARGLTRTPHFSLIMMLVVQGAGGATKGPNLLSPWKFELQ